MNQQEINALDWKKMNGLLPAIIQNAENGNVLMLGYMDQEALIATVTTEQLSLYSRSRKRVWRHGETSGDTLFVKQISVDGDSDSLLVLVIPKGRTNSNYHAPCKPSLSVLDELMEVINTRSEEESNPGYTAKLLHSGVNQCAEKIGAEAVKIIIAAIDNNNEELLSTGADLIFHLLVLLKARELSFYEVLNALQARD